MAADEATGEGARDEGEGVGGSGLSASLETAWGLRERPSKGPKPGLSLDRIVDAGIAIAAAEGIGAVTMGRVAKALGASPMSLYRYVSARDELYVLMQDAATGFPPEMPAAITGWRARLEWWARAQREVFRRNLWLVRIPITSPPVSPHSLEWMEQGLAALDGSGLEEGQKLSVLMLVGGFVRNEVVFMADLDTAMRAGGKEPDEVMRQYARTIDALTSIAPERFPALRRTLATGVLDVADAEDTEFEFGIGRVLDGVAVLIGDR
ncbi:TetR/AcrR family transcriptional regulator C-terminal domain-containing protein [Streptomyces sp. NBC_01283]|uniref:TetR/AcrR family transcriptional regulator C-terminal domain-containing protein n=1 Tax=Streptomyces sp. NBC_01283 TaxID=2903812 RepID=UPI00352C5EB1|nr:TetR/AcrR family transcriptional regulator C-terminal domain-containing protein [Streptomyces sp. NBC_01283]